jgi:serine/threonine protein kinase
MEDLLGKTLGSYQIKKLIGQGGMATVYKAYQPALDREVAIKVLPPQMANDPDFAERFTREARAVAKLEHPHILPIYDFGQEGDLSYIAMRYVQGGTLASLVGKSHQLSRISELLTQVTSALEYAHTHGVVHRDVKPTNVLLDQGNWVLLTDFGIARMMGGETRITATGVTIGTPDYMSPEQGLGKHVDHRSDIYSLGAMLFELLTGRVPYEADTPMAVIIKHIHDPLPSPREINPIIPIGVEQVIVKALSKNPDDRHQSAGELAKAFDEVIKRSKTTIIKPTRRIIRKREEPKTKKGKWIIFQRIRQNLFVFILILLVLGAAGILLASGIIQNGNPEEASTTPEVSDTIIPVASKSPISSQVIQTISPTPNTSPTAEETKSTPSMTFTTTLAPSSTITPALPNPRGIKLHVLEGHLNTITGAVFSPEGDYLVSGSWDGSLMIWDVVSGNRIRTLWGHEGGVTSVEFSPNGDTFASGSNDGTIGIWDAQTWEKIHTLEGYGMKYSPDGNIIASYSYSITYREYGDQPIILWDVHTGERISSFEVSGYVSFNPSGDFIASWEWEEEVVLWDVQTKEVLRKFEPARSVSFSPDGEKVALGSSSNVSIWNVYTGEKLYSFDGWSLQFSPDGEMLSTYSNDELYLWNVSTGEMLNKLDGGWAFAFSPDGRIIASAVSRRIFLWDTKTGQQLVQLEGHYSFIRNLKFSPNGDLLVSIGADRVIIIWDVSQQN